MVPQERDNTWQSGEMLPMVVKDGTTFFANGDVTTYVHKPCDVRDPVQHNGMRSLPKQAIMCFVVYLCATHGGMIAGYINILLPQLNNTNSTLYTDDTASSIASVYTVSTPVGSLLCGFLMGLIGRKPTLQLGIFLSIPGWLLLIFAQNHAMIFTGIFIIGASKGLSGGSQMMLQDELADPKTRGVMCCMGFIFVSLGIFIVSTLGVIWSWQLVAGISCVLAFLCLASTPLVVESPTWLARNGKSKAAERSLNWIWGPSKEIEAKCDLDKILLSIQQEEKERINTNAGNWRILLTPRILKPFFIIHGFNLFQLICGTSLMLFFSLKIMQQIETTISMDSKLAAVLISIVRVVFMVVACVLIFWIGRRSLALLSGVGSSMAAIVIGTFLYIQSESSIDFPGMPKVVIALVLIFIATNTCGFFVLPSVMLGEILPAKVRSFASGYIYAMNDVTMAFVIKSFYPLSQSLGSHGVFWLFGGSSVVCTVLVLLFLPETQGLSLEQIENYFAQDNIMWQTRRKHQTSSLNQKHSSP